MLSSSPKKTGYNSKISEFMRNASSSEKQRVFMKVIDASIEAQQKVIARADEIIAARAKRDSN